MLSYIYIYHIMSNRHIVTHTYIYICIILQIIQNAGSHWWVGTGAHFTCKPGAFVGAKGLGGCTVHLLQQLGLYSWCGVKYVSAT